MLYNQSHFVSLFGANMVRPILCRLLKSQCLVWFWNMNARKNIYGRVYRKGKKDTCIHIPPLLPQQRILTHMDRERGRMRKIKKEWKRERKREIYERIAEVMFPLCLFVRNALGTLWSVPLYKLTAFSFLILYNINCLYTHALYNPWSKYQVRILNRHWNRVCVWC